MVLPGFHSATYLSLSGPNTWTLEPCFKRSAKWISGHLSAGSGQTKECFWAPALPEQPKFDPWGVGWASEPGALPSASTYHPGCHPCTDPRAAFRRFFSRPWLHVNAEDTDGSWFIHQAGAECSTSETPRCLPLCFGPSLYKSFPVEAPASCPYSCSYARGERKLPWRSQADSYWKWFLYHPYNREDNSLRTNHQSQSKCPAGAE